MGKCEQDDNKEETMLVRIFGVLFVIAGAFIVFGILGGLIGLALGVIWFACKLAVPLLLIYVGYRILTRNQRVPLYD